MKTLALTPLKKIQTFIKFFQYQPHAKQLEVHLSDKRFKTVAAGARAGKSMLGGAEAAITLLLPGKHVWFVSSVFSLADKEFDWMLEFLTRCPLAGKKIIDFARLSNPSRGVRKIKFPWGSWAETKSSAKPETLLGEELDLIVIGEASQLPKSAWNRQLRARLGSRRGGALALATPNWDGGFFKEFFESGKSEDLEFDDYESWQFSVLANPTFSRAEYEIAKLTLPEKIFKEQYDGEFVSRSGAVFPQFSEAFIVNELPDELKNWPIMVGIHHEKNSFNNPISIVFVAVDPQTKHFWVVDEFYQSQTLVEEVIKEIENKVKGKRVITTLTDYYNYTLQEQLREKMSVNINNEKKYTKRHAVVRRIQVVQTALKSREIFIYSKCENTINEFKNCKWPDPKKEEAGLAESEMPRTKFLNLPLALSYILAFCRIAQGIDIYTAQGRKGA